MSEAPQPQTISPQAVADAAATGLTIFDKEIPMTRAERQHVGVLEIVLSALANGQAIIANAPQPGVESEDGQDLDDDIVDEDEDEAPPKRRKRRKPAKPRAVK